MAITEAPLFEERCFTLFVNGQPLELMLCSQGHWRELALGYLLSQGRIGGMQDVENVGETADGQGIDVKTRAPLRPAAFLTARLDALPPFPGKADAEDALIRSLGLALQEDAPFGRHRAVIVCGEKQAMFDDAGRHNACDKAIGHALLSGWNLRDCLLGTSGRLSLEMLGKAASSGIPLLFTLKYPSDLCLTYADRLNLRLIARAASAQPIRM